jgi:cytosine/adenosine deaminase-related metal-dependent hydrolase
MNRGNIIRYTDRNIIRQTDRTPRNAAGTKTNPQSSKIAPDALRNRATEALQEDSQMGITTLVTSVEVCDTTRRNAAHGKNGEPFLSKGVRTNHYTTEFSPICC